VVESVVVSYSDDRGIARYEQRITPEPDPAFSPIDSRNPRVEEVRAK
jgi:hypothetical protein